MAQPTTKAKARTASVEPALATNTRALPHSTRSRRDARTPPFNTRASTSPLQPPGSPPKDLEYAPDEEPTIETAQIAVCCGPNTLRPISLIEIKGGHVTSRQNSGEPRPSPLRRMDGVMDLRTIMQAESSDRSDRSMPARSRVVSRSASAATHNHAYTGLHTVSQSRYNVNFSGHLPRSRHHAASKGQSPSNDQPDLSDDAPKKWYGRPL